MLLSETFCLYDGMVFVFTMTAAAATTTTDSAGIIDDDKKCRCFSVSVHHEIPKCSVEDVRIMESWHMHTTQGR